ncbi:MAG: hypothetical protein EP335_12865 [Alphaproteobacteria bacterium]|nr:MAG: hypothetical protein EP335_12865 [Alphaproteobacteria bacterium]
MTQTNNKQLLEGARTRLEAALSRLAQGVASSREALVVAHEMAEDKRALGERVARLEAENLKLHEQVAAFALAAPAEAADDGRAAALEAEKAALEQNYQLLKRQYASLQDELELAQDAPAAPISDSELAEENARLKQEVLDLTAARDGIRAELDSAIEQLESMIAEA